VETVKDFELSLNRMDLPASPYSHPISPHCGIYLFLKEEEPEIVAWGEENLSL
jgi:hypothetical protein